MTSALVAAALALLVASWASRSYVVELVRRLDSSYHGPGCDGPYNCTCGGGR